MNDIVVNLVDFYSYAVCEFWHSRLRFFVVVDCSRCISLYRCNCLCHAINLCAVIALNTTAETPLVYKMHLPQIDEFRATIINAVWCHFTKCIVK